MVFFFTLQGWFHGRTGVGVDGEERVEIDIRAGWLSDVKFSPNVPQIIFFFTFHKDQRTSSHTKLFCKRARAAWNISPKCFTFYFENGEISLPFLEKKEWNFAVQGELNRKWNLGTVREQILIKHKILSRFWRIRWVGAGYSVGWNISRGPNGR